MIKGIGLSKSFGEQRLFKELYFDAKPGDFVGLVGNTGCGKSTLLNILSGYDTSDKGEVVVDDENYKDFSTRDINNFRKRKIAFLFQSCNLLEDLTVFENLKLSVNLRGSENDKIDDYLDKLKLQDLKHKRVSKLSGGEKQRIAFLRAIIKDFDILICDEPTGNLDDTNANIVLNLIKEECKNKIVIMVTHKKSIANDFFNKLYQYNKKTMNFEIVVDETSVVESVSSKGLNKGVSVIGIIKHALSRVKVKLFFNMLMVFLIVFFLSSFGATSVLSQGIFREIQIDAERKLLPIDEIVLTSKSGSVEELEAIDDVEYVSIRYNITDNYKLLGKEYSRFGKADHSPENADSLVRVTVINDGREEYKFLSEATIKEFHKDLSFTQIPSEEDFVYSEKIVGEYPGEGDVLIDVVTVLKLLSDPNFSIEKYYNGKVSAESIFKGLRGQYLEFYKIKTLEDDRSAMINQEIHNIKFRISGIIDSGRASKYIDTVYTHEDEIIKIMSQARKNNKREFVVYKVDATRKTHEFFLSDLSSEYKYDNDVIDLYGEAYNRIKVVVDYNLFMARVSAVVFFLGFLILVLYIFTHNKYDIAVYRSLGYSHFVTSFVLSFNYILFIGIGALLSFGINRGILSKLLNYDSYFVGIFDQGVIASAVILIVTFFTVLLSYVIRYSKKPINSIIDN